MTAMDPEALVTFLFRAPPEVRTVELMGSWDNFNQPYRMHHDRRRGNGFWSGCFKFQNIIFDGEDFHWTKPRSGGLKQGGTYWYHYRLNYDIDAYDDRQQYTTSCPLLPGQAVNIIEVPYEMIEPPARCHSAYGVTEDIAGSLANVGEEKTLDPAQKMAALEPPPISKVHSRCLSDEALDGRLENQNGPAIVVGEVVSPVSTTHHEAPDGSRDSKMSHYLPAKDDSRPISAFSTRSAERAAGSAIPGTFNLGPSGYSKDCEDGGLPSFPYPSDLGPTPLGSDEALQAAMFTSDDVIAHVCHTQSNEELDEEACKQMRRISELSLGPMSVQNVQFYGSRPGTSLTEDPEQHRPRMYSLPNMEIRDHLDDSSPVSPTSCYSHRASEDVDESPTPDSDGAVFDLISPTFTASTVDTDGHDTPFRLSSQTSCSSSDPAAEDDFDASRASADRQWSLTSGQDRARHETVNVTTNDRSHPRLLSPPFINYSLPSLASESNHSLTKTITMSPPQRQTPRFRQEVHMPIPTIFNEGEGRSMAEDIFSELGF